jgi:WD40 repeat protein
MKKVAFLFFSIIYILLANVYLYAQIPASSTQIINISGNAADSLLAVSDKKCVTVYDTSDYSQVCVFDVPKAEKTAFFTENGVEYISILTGDGNLSVRKLKKRESFWYYDSNEPYFSMNLSQSEWFKKAECLAVSNNSDYMAVAENDNIIKLYYRLRLTQNAITKSINNHKSKVYGLEFDFNSEYLASVSEDGEAFIWRTSNGTQIGRLNDVYTLAKVPVCFTGDSAFIVSQESENSFRISELSGKTLYSIMTGQTITMIKPLKNPDLIAIGNDKKEIVVFSISAKKAVSVFEVKRNTLLSAFEFNVTGDSLYAGFRDGSVKLVDSRTGIRDSGVKVIDISDDLKGKDSKNKKNTVSVDESEQNKEQTKEQKTESKIEQISEPKTEQKTKQNTDAKSEPKSQSQSETNNLSGNNQNLSTGGTKGFSCFSVCGGANYMTSPFFVSGNLRMEYLYSQKISPFFIGMGLIASCGFPRKDFPAQYIIKEQNVNPPDLLSAVLYIPFGYAFFPWNKPVLINTVFRAGAKVSSVALITKEGTIIGDPFLSLFLSAGVGMQIKWFAFDINCEYDSVGKINPSVYIGCVFRWDSKNKKGKK